MSESLPTCCNGDENGACCPGPMTSPETETDANGLREAERFLRELVTDCDTTERGHISVAMIPFVARAIVAMFADLDAARERVRVVEGERDAARAGALEKWEYVCEIARAIGIEPDDGHPMDAVDRLTARAESAEADRAALVAAVEGLADEWLEAGVVEDGVYPKSAVAAEDMCARALRALAGGAR